MASQINLFLRVLQALNDYDVEYILIGGVAVILHGLNRLTRDIDIFINLDEANIERLRGALRSVFDDASIEEITFEELRKYPVIRYGTPQDFYIDILARLGEASQLELAHQKRCIT
jgi:predicted nucleotidyltransferase